MADVADLVLMLWHHGTFPLRWVVYCSAAAFLAGVWAGIYFHG